MDLVRDIDLAQDPVIEVAGIEDLDRDLEDPDPDIVPEGTVLDLDRNALAPGPELRGLVLAIVVDQDLETVLVAPVQEIVGGLVLEIVNRNRLERIAIARPNAHAPNQDPEDLDRGLGILSMTLNPQDTMIERRIKNHLVTKISSLMRAKINQRNQSLQTEEAPILQDVNLQADHLPSALLALPLAPVLAPHRGNEVHRKNEALRGKGVLLASVALQLHQGEDLGVLMLKEMAHPKVTEVLPLRKIEVPHRRAVVFHLKTIVEVAIPLMAVAVVRPKLAEVPVRITAAVLLLI